MTPGRLQEALAAWNTHDAERVLSFFSDDCSYHASFGPELLGRSYVGRFQGTEVFVAGDRGAAEWTFVADGESVRGCDLFEFDGDLIRVKNAFRKVSDT